SDYSRLSSCFVLSFFSASGALPDLHSFPTRRSSDLLLLTQTLAAVVALLAGSLLLWGARMPRRRIAFLLAGGAVALALLAAGVRSEEHSSELQSRGHLVCRLLLEKKKHIKQ